MVFPIFEAGDRSNLNTYRPVSVLPIFSKFFERIVKFFVSSHIGFRPNLSASRAVSNTLQFIYNNSDDGSVVVSIFFGLRKSVRVRRSHNIIK